MSDATASEEAATAAIEETAAKSRAEACEADIQAALAKHRCAFSPRVLFEQDRQTIARVEITIVPLK